MIRARTRWCVVWCVPVAILLLLSASDGTAQQTCTVEPFEYVSDGLRIRGEMARPSGPGPFPVVIANHGDERWRQRDLKFSPNTDCRAWTQKGWIFFFPDRRGAGRSEGPLPPWLIPEDQRLSPEAFSQVLEKWTEETSRDVLGGLTYLKSLGFADLTRVAIFGWSGGADPTIYAAGAAPAAFRAVVVQAGSIPFTSHFPDLGLGLYAKWARPIAAPILLQYARQDRGALPSFGQDFAQALQGMGKDVTLHLYDGPHTLFGPMPYGVWEKDFVDFLTRHLAPM